MKAEDKPENGSNKFEAVLQKLFKPETMNAVSENRLSGFGNVSMPQKH